MAEEKSVNPEDQLTAELSGAVKKYVVVDGKPDIQRALKALDMVKSIHNKVVDSIAAATEQLKI